MSLWSSRRRRVIPVVIAAVGFAGVAACVPKGTPVAPVLDANNASATLPHGWFQGGKTWQGDFGDPDILRIGNTYYAYSSSAGGRFLSVETSTDLKTWTIHPNWSSASGPNDPNWTVGVPPELLSYGDTPVNEFFNNDALVRPASWGLKTTIPGDKWLNETYWAPSVFSITTQSVTTWYAYSAVKVSNVGDPRDPHGYGRFCLTVASAPSPMGPFRDISGAHPIQCQPVATDPSGSIDPYPYHDPTNGLNYLLWKAAGKVGGAESSIKSVQLGTNGLPLPGAPVNTLLQTNRAAPWEGSTIENPSMVFYGDVSYLFYSANDSLWYDSDGRSNYATGYAICHNGPRGACGRAYGGVAPLLSSKVNDVSQGPGGASPVVGPTGQLYLAYASYWLGENRLGYHPRRLHIIGLAQGPGAALHIG